MAGDARYSTCSRYRDPEISTADSTVESDGTGSQNSPAVPAIAKTSEKKPNTRCRDCIKE
jgi:hypothetical protein